MTHSTKRRASTWWMTSAHRGAQGGPVSSTFGDHLRHLHEHAGDIPGNVFDEFGVAAPTAYAAAGSANSSAICQGYSLSRPHVL